MRKVGLLILALVFALGALGAGYAMWSDEIVIKGTVNTGTVDITVDEYSSTYVYKDLDNNELINSDEPMEGNYLLVAYATAEEAVNSDADVIMTFDNLFPGEIYCADFGGEYTGTIPVHVAADIAVCGEDAEAFADLWDLGYINYVVQVWDTEENEVEIGDVVQLHQGYRYNVALCIEIPQEIELDDQVVNSKEFLSGKSACFVAKIVAYQWNEAAPEVILPECPNGDE